MSRLKRSEKGTRIARYLTGHAAIPNISYHMEGGRVEIELPRPYSINVTTDNKNERFFAQVRAVADQDLAFTIRYDATIPSVDNAVVGMTLRDFAILLKSHYENQEK